jgi:hypothetical protein
LRWGRELSFTNPVTNHIIVDMRGCHILLAEINNKEIVEMNKVVEELGKIGIVPVIALDDAKDAEPLAKALVEGGFLVRRLRSGLLPQRSQSKSWLRSFLRLLSGQERSSRLSRLTGQ